MHTCMSACVSPGGGWGYVRSIEHFKQYIIVSTTLHLADGSVDELASAYSDRLSSLVDMHASLRTKTIVLRPSCLCMVLR